MPRTRLVNTPSKIIAAVSKNASLAAAVVALAAPRSRYVGNRAVNMAVEMVTPSIIPSWRAVLTTPLAIPCRCIGTEPMMAP